MAPEKEKKKSALDSPPEASSGEEEVEDIEEEEDEEEVEEGREEEEEEEGDEDDDEGDDEDDDDDDDDGSDSRFTVKKHTVVPTPQPQSSSMVDEDESDTDSDSDPPTTQVFDPNVKPLNSVPMEEDNGKQKKSSKAAVTPASRSSAGKRSTEAEKSEKDSKRRKKNGDGEETQKKSGMKSWSEDDEIVILKAMVSLMKKGAKPTDLNALYESLKNSLNGDVTKDQLTNKLRGFKRKFQGLSGRLMKGEELNLKPHDLKSYEYLKKIYGQGDGKAEGVSEATMNGGTPSVKKEGKSKSRKVSNDVTSPKPEVMALQEVSQKIVNEASVGGGEDQVLSNVIRFSKGMQLGDNMIAPHSSQGESLLKEGLELLGDSRKKDLEQKWRKLRIAETKIFLERIELIRDQTKMALDALESADE